MNKDRLLQVKQAILDNPDHFDMSFWFNSDSIRGLGKCGTVGCIAGWTCHLFANECKGFNLDYVLSDKSNTSSIAAELLDLTEEEAEYLFHEANWSKRLWDKATPEEAAKVIDDLIENGKPEDEVICISREIDDPLAMEIANELFDMFNLANALDWLDEENPKLGNKTPKEYIAQGGAATLLNLLRYS